MTGRFHQGDENGQTKYQYATLKVVDGNGNPVSGVITIESVQWSASFKESSGGGFTAIPPRVIVGRQHSGDENGNTSYATALIKFNGITASLTNSSTSALIKESSGIWFVTDVNKVMTGRHHPAQQLEISDENGVEVLKVYSARGTHANYPNTGSFPIADVTANGGYQWDITEKYEQLNTQPWRLFSGGWGEVGVYLPVLEDSTTGPLGPWYKRYDFGKQDDSNIALSQLISQNEVLLFPINRRESSEFSESSNYQFTAPANCLITGRVHWGDENGFTKYQISQLGAIDSQGMLVLGVVTIVDLQWSDWHKESDSGNFFFAPTNRVITGRQHDGDENGNTRYQTGKVLFNGLPTTVVTGSSLLSKINAIESSNIYFITASRFILTARTHTGDENGKTSYYQGYIFK